MYEEQQQQLNSQLRRYRLGKQRTTFFSKFNTRKEQVKRVEEMLEDTKSQGGVQNMIRTKDETLFRTKTFT